ncbi:response regulator [Skermanella mucosa]|uniref:response regulator n=1 Tax=Skermanella mucosa TaxID=1789672 RepID=UPI00192B0D40|nr:response regulator [Skermanella mucosa]UEM21713.1 response regulator [Skermanella mucosa]
MSFLRVSVSETGVAIMGAEVFIIDDRSVNRKILTKFASSVGDDINVSAFPNPVEALDACRRTVPDLVITDFKMPLMDGAGFIRALRGHPGTADVPVIVVTAYEDHEIRREALEAGATDFILSPVDPWEFQTRARNLLRLRAQQFVIHRQTVRESEERFRLLVEGVRDYAIVMLDPAGLVTSWNAGAERLLGYCESEILGQPAGVLDPAAGIGVPQGEGASGGVGAMLALAASDGSVHGEHVRVRKDGSRFQADILVTAMRDDAGRLAGFSMVTHDITTRRDMEAALRDALAESQVLLRELHHRVRNNLQVISTVLYLQTLGMPEGDLKHGYRRTQQRIDGLGLLFRNLLGPSRITSVRFDGYLVDLCNSLVRDFDAGRQLVRRADIGSLALELDMAGPLGLVIAEILFTVAEGAPARTGGGLMVRVEPESGGLRLSFEFDRDPGAGPPLVGGRYGLGPAVMAALVDQLGARIALDEAAVAEDGPEDGAPAPEVGARISLTMPASLFEPV